MESLDDEGDMTERLSGSSLCGTAVREELSEENRLEPLVADDAVDLMLAPSNDLRCPESVVEVESYVICCVALLSGRPHCCSFVPLSPG